MSALLKLSVVIPAHNEEGCIEATVRDLHTALVRADVPHELVVVDDASTDGTACLLKDLSLEIPTLKRVYNSGNNGFGMAVRLGLESFSGEVVAVYMADSSDSPKDLIRFYRHLKLTGVDCVFGTRFAQDSNIVDYPRFKLFLNRLANKFIQLLFGLNYNDVTNAFKMYRAPVIQGLKPFLSHHFNLTVELPLKAIIRGYSYAILPNDWFNRKAGVSKLRIKEMGSRYLFIVLYCFIERWLSRGDYRATESTTQSLSRIRQSATQSTEI